jgi:hypothetical protein
VGLLGPAFGRSTGRKIMKSLIIGAVLLFAASGATAPQLPVYTPPTASAGAVRDVDFSAARPLDEDYRAQFARCDRENIFRGKRMRGRSRCSTDPNRVRALLKFPNGAVFFESKMGLDLDGSHKACSDPGSADQCPTWFTWPGLTGKASFVDSDKFPYVVIPIAGPSVQRGREFRNKTGVAAGDLGVVVFRDKVVPVFVADGGPHNKLGEGSAALFRELGEDRCRETDAAGHCKRYLDASIERGVLFFIFPGSKIQGLTPENALETVRREALRRFAEL